MKYVFKCVTPQQDLAGNVYALENGVTTSYLKNIKKKEEETEETKFK